MGFIGVDAHRTLLVAVAVDESGKGLGTWSGRNREQGWTELLSWAEALAGDAERVWGIEGSGNQGRGLAQLLVGQGEVVLEINPRITAESRARSRRRDKSDQTDARAITRALRESWEELLRVTLADATSPLAILTRERESLQADITRQRNHWHLGVPDASTMSMSAVEAPRSSPPLRPMPAGARCRCVTAARPRTSPTWSASCSTSISPMRLCCAWCSIISTPILYETFAPAEARRLAPRLEWHYTPKHGSWLNMVELELSILARQCLDQHLPDRQTAQQHCTAWATMRNQAQATVTWQFTTPEARRALKPLYPKLGLPHDLP